jgi:hypothetical protein
LLTKSQLQVGSLLITFLTPLALAFFLAEVKRTFTYFSTTHHNLGSSRTTPSHLGGFTSKRNKCHEDCLTKLKFPSRSQREISHLKLDHKSLKPHKEVLGKAHKGLEMSMFPSWHQQPPKEGGGNLLYLPQKTSCWKLASKN